MLGHYWSLEGYACQCELNHFEFENKVEKGHPHESVRPADEQSLPNTEKGEVAVEDADARDWQMQEQDQFAREV